MKKIIYKQYYLILIPIIVGALLIASCEKEELFTESQEVTEKNISDIETQEKIAFSTPDDPDFRPPRIPRPPQFDAFCVVRLSYLSYLRRCPENANVVNGWVSVLLSRGFDDLAEGFITSAEARVKWNSQYHSFLSRNNLSNVDVHLFIYIAYRGMLLREPDVNGGIGWTNLLYQRGLKSVVNGIANSQEFRNRLAGIFVECRNADSQCQY